LQWITAGKSERNIEVQKFRGCSSQKDRGKDGGGRREREREEEEEKRRGERERERKRERITVQRPKK
jgi:hypothetical protein